MRSAAREMACGMMGMDEAPVPPKTDPRINTLGVPFCAALVSCARKLFSSLSIGLSAASRMAWYIIIEPR